MQHCHWDNSSDQSQPDHPAARARYQELLDQISTHFWAQDWASLEPFFVFPNRVSSKDAERVIDSFEACVAMMSAARDSYERIGAKEYHRLCRGARFTDGSQTEITGRHVTYILRDAQFVIRPYTGYLTAVLHEGTWRAAGIHADKREADLPTIHADLLSPQGLHPR